MSMDWVYVSLWLCVFGLFCVARVNKVEGTMSWCIGTNEILASNITFTRLKVKQGQFDSWFETAILILHNFSSFITAKGV